MASTIIVNSTLRGVYFAACNLLVVVVLMVSVHLRMQGAVNFALMMSQLEGGCPVDYNVITDLFLQVWINAGSGLAWSKSFLDYQSISFPLSVTCLLRY